MPAHDSKAIKDLDDFVTKQNDNFLDINLLPDLVDDDEAILGPKERYELHTGETPTSESIETIMCAIHTRNLKRIKDDSLQAYEKLAKLQAENTVIQKIISAINAATDGTKGSLDFSTIPHLDEILDKARELKMELPEMKGKLNSEQRMRLLDNIKMISDANNIEINMKTNEINNLQFTLQESYQWMRSHIKTLDDSKRKPLAGIAR